MFYADIIKESVKVRDVCDLYGIEVNAAGFARCPFHNEKTASFKVFKDGCKCFGCGEYAQNSIDLVMKLFGLSFVQACEKINNDFHLDLPLSRAPSLREVREAENQLRIRQAIREAEKSERDQLEKKYHAAYDEWCRLDKQRMENEPKCAAEINDLYADALKRLPWAAYMLDKAESELWQYDNRRNQNN